MDRLSRALRRASAIADAVLALADQCNQWPPGVLVPAGARAQTGAPDSAQTECLLVPATGARLAVRLRYRWAQLWRVDWADADPSSAARRGADQSHADQSAAAHPSSFLGGVCGVGAKTVRRRVDVVLPVAELAERVRRFPFALPGSQRSHPMPGAAGAWLTRRRWPLSGVLEVSAHRLPGLRDALRLRVEVHNDVVWRAYDAPPTAALRRALIGVHVLLAVSDGHFVSIVDPPDWARPAAADCVNARTWPVLVGDPRRNDTMLAAPIPLTDYPVAPDRTSVVAPAARELSMPLP
ncbi:MAG: hypothetical protein DIU79_03420 [Actinobacteria bacterium]|nr:MAG: hypothetical protein DIU79_03420 [Actinomycetota bacterium]